MNRELQKKLMEKYPKIFVAGCPCPEYEWYLIIDSLCDIIQSRCDFRNNVVNEGKYPIGHRLHMQTKCTGVTYGGDNGKRDSMRFHIEDGDSFIDGAIQMSEKMCSKAKNE